MTIATRKPLRLWPGVVIAILLGLARFVVPVVKPDLMVYGVLGGFLGGALVFLWWLLFSRAVWFERLGAIALSALALYAVKPIVHESIASGAMGYLLSPGDPGAGPGFCGVGGGHPAPPGRGAARDDGRDHPGCMWIDGADPHRWLYRRLPKRLALPLDENSRRTTGGANGHRASGAPAGTGNGGGYRETARGPSRQRAGGAAPPAREAATLPPAPARIETGADWPGFRGPHRDGVVSGVRIKTDWTASPPVALWRRPIGPGWSSFAVRGDLIYTQEQRGDDEVVTCYN